jgi:hypothetical protein
MNFSNETEKVVVIREYMNPTLMREVMSNNEA